MKDYRAGHLEDALHVHEGLKEVLVKRGDKQRILLIYVIYGPCQRASCREFFSDFALKHVLQPGRRLFQLERAILIRRLKWMHYP